VVSSSTHPFCVGGSVTSKTRTAHTLSTEVYRGASQALIIIWQLWSLAMNLRSNKPDRLLLIATCGLALSLPFVGSAAFATREPRASQSTSAELLGNPDFILLRRGPIETSSRTASRHPAAADQRISAARLSEITDRLALIQFMGPVKRDWLTSLVESGLQLIAYVPNYAYVVRGPAAAMSRIGSMEAFTEPDEVRPIRWVGRLEPIQKIDPLLFTDGVPPSSDQVVDVSIELFDSPSVDATLRELRNLSSNGLNAPRRSSHYQVVSGRIAASNLINAAALDDVLFIGPAPHFRPLDEMSDQIVAGNLISDGSKPTSPGYSQWLASKGLDFIPDFLVEVVDTGLDRGSTSASQIHPDFRDPDGNSRILYSVNYANDNEIEDRLGHGTLVASVVAGLGSASVVDPSGYVYGLGMDPTMRLGISRIFDRLGQTPSRIDFASIAAAAYAKGARIANNSWGSDGNTYDVVAQEYDSLVRDADVTAPGNQEMTFVFAVGNTGPGGHVDSPAVAKNVIAVGASESFRPLGTDSCNLDGEGSIGPDGADNALDILRYSSGGPTADGRTKPDLVAPGTHIYGAASRSQFFFGQGLCPGIPVFQPPNQDLYTWSSGTSLAAPHVSGAAALVRKFFTSQKLLGEGVSPSPAMIKAFLSNSATYLTGANGGGNLPSQRQGWGLVDLSRAFDSAKRVLVDQTELFTESGQEFAMIGSVADRSLPMRITLAWTDAPASLLGPAIVNDLDLEVRTNAGVVYRGNIFADEFSIEGGTADRLNNVESICLPAGFFPEGTSGSVTITVRAANIAGDGVPGNGSLLDQDFSLVAYNFTSEDTQPPANPPVITAASYVKKLLTIVGHDFSLAAQVEINGKTIERPFAFDPLSNALSIKLKAKKLNLIKRSDNSIVVTENGLRSEVFTLRL
jgi:hypothetical protein